MSAQDIENQYITKRKESSVYSYLADKAKANLIVNLLPRKRGIKILNCEQVFLRFLYKLNFISEVKLGVYHS